jgi:hypothetical protein
MRTRRRSASNPQRHAVVSVFARSLARFDSQYDDFTAQAAGFIESECFADGG